MATLTIKIPENAKSRLSELVKELGGEILSVSKKDHLKKVKESDPVLDEIKEGLREVRAMREGKIESLSMSDLRSGK